ncbi:MAG: CHAT domain-containing protein, partial [Acidimicrobiia bacterium]
DEHVGRDRFRMHVNRGLVLLQQGELERAEIDFLTAAGVAHELGLTSAEGQCHANLGVLYGRGRRVLDSLRAFDRAERLLEVAGRPSRITTGMEIDRAEVLMHSGLLDDAVAAAGRALVVARASANSMLLGDALLLCARTQLQAGHRAAMSTVIAAGEHLLASGRADMVAHAESLRAHAELRHVELDDADTFVRAEAIIGRLRGLGWHQQADELATERLRAAWRLGSWDLVVAELADLRLHAFGTRRDLALLGWFAEAVVRHLDGDAPGSVEACRKGLSFLDDIIAEATDLEARSAAMRLGNDLSRWIIEVAVAEHDADLVLAASEGTRARALHEEVAGREQHRPLSDEGADRLRTELRGRLSGRCLVQWVVAGERVHAVVCDETGNRVVDVADLRSVVRERDRAMMWLDRAAVEPDDSSARASRAAALLDELLLAPLGLPDAASVVIVPVDELHGVPWSGLPSIAAGPVVLSPSCRLWLDADRRASSPIRSVGFVAGPNVGADDAERTALRRSYGRVDEATGAGATAATVRTMFRGHDLVHVAAHGRFRADRPLLSTFELADGEVTLHESVPDRVGARLAVLSSCEGGAHRGTT